MHSFEGATKAATHVFIKPIGEGCVGPNQAEVYEITCEEIPSSALECITLSEYVTGKLKYDEERTNIQMRILKSLERYIADPVGRAV